MGDDGDRGRPAERRIRQEGGRNQDTIDEVVKAIADQHGQHGLPAQAMRVGVRRVVFFLRRAMAVAPQRGSLQRVKADEPRQQHGKQRVGIGSRLKGLGQDRQHRGAKQQSRGKPDHAWQPVVRQALQQKTRHHDAQDAAQQGGQQYGG